MVFEQVGNFVRQDVRSSIASSDSLIEVVDASVFPDPDTDPYHLVIWNEDEFNIPSNDANREIVQVTGWDTEADELTVSRGEEDTSANDHPDTSKVQLAATAEFLNTRFAERDASDVAESGSHSDLSDVGENDHHDKNHDHSEGDIAAVQSVGSNVVGPTELSTDNPNDKLDSVDYTPVEDVDAEISVAADTVSELDSVVNGKAEQEDISDIQSSSDVDHDSTTGGTSGTPHDHADPGDWDNDVVEYDTLSDLDSQVSVNESDIGTNASDISSLETDKLDSSDYTPVSDVDAEVTQTAASVSGLDSETDLHISAGNPHSDSASTADVSDIQSSSDVDHDSTVGGTSGTPHDHADPGDWDNDVTSTADSLSGLDSSTDSHISAGNPHSDSASTSDISDIQSSSDVDHNDTEGGTSGTPHDHADPGDWDADVTTAASSLSGLDSQVDTNISDISSLDADKLDEVDYTPEDDTHDRYSDSEARSAVDGSTLDLSGIEVSDRFAAGIGSSGRDAVYSFEGNRDGATFYMNEDYVESGGGFEFRIHDDDSDFRNAIKVYPDDESVDVSNGELLEQGNRVATRTWTNSNFNNLESHDDLIDVDSDDHHTRYSDSEATSAVGGSTPWSNTDLENSTVTVAGNSVSLGGSTGVSHSDLSGISSDDHHSRYADSEARSAIESGNLSRIDGVNSHRIRFDSDSSYIEITDHDNNRSDMVTGDLYVDDLNGGTWLAGIVHSDLDGISSDDHHSRYSDSEARNAITDGTLTGDFTSEISSNDVWTVRDGSGGDNDSPYTFRFDQPRNLRWWSDDYGTVFTVKHNGSVEFEGTAYEDGDRVATRPWVDSNFNDYTFSESHNDLSDISSDDHHSRYSDSEARSAVDGSTLSDLEVDTTLTIPVYSSEPSGSTGDIAVIDGELHVYE